MSNLNKCPTDDLGSVQLMELRRLIRVAYSNAIALATDPAARHIDRAIAGHTNYRIVDVLEHFEKLFQFYSTGPGREALSDEYTDWRNFGFNAVPEPWKGYGGSTGKAPERLSPHERESTGGGA